MPVLCGTGKMPVLCGTGKIPVLDDGATPIQAKN